MSAEHDPAGLLDLDLRDPLFDLDEDLNTELEDGDILLHGQQENPYKDVIPQECADCGQRYGYRIEWLQADAPPRSRRRLWVSARAAEDGKARCKDCGGPRRLIDEWAQLLTMTTADRRGIA